MNWKEGKKDKGWVSFGRIGLASLEKAKGASIKPLY